MVAVSEDRVNRYRSLCVGAGVEDERWPGWQTLTARLGGKVQFIGDELLVTNVERVQRAIAEKSCNALLCKVNQIGTLSEAIQAVTMSQHAGWNVQPLEDVSAAEFYTVRYRFSGKRSAKPTWLRLWLRAAQGWVYLEVFAIFAGFVVMIPLFFSAVEYGFGR